MTGSIPVRATKKAALRAAFVLSSTNPDNKPDKQETPLTALVKQLMNETRNEENGTLESVYPPFKKAKVYNGDKEWFVEVYYWSLSQHKYIRDKARLSLRRLSKEERQVHLEKLCSTLNKYFDSCNKKMIFMDETARKSKKIKAAGPVVEEIYSHTLKNWVDTAIADVKNTDISDDFRDTLISFGNNLDAFHKHYPHYQDIFITDISDDFFSDFLLYLNDKELAGKTINKYLGAYDRIVKYVEKATKNKVSIPIKDTLNLRVAQPKNETGRFPPLNHEEKTRAFDYFRARDPHFHLFISFIYYTCIRGAELYRLQRKHIDLAGRKIYVPWFNSKNGLSNHVQILEPLYNLLMEMQVDKLSGEMFLFGAKFLPSKEQYEGPQASNKWYNHRENMHMPKEKQCYGLKHSFNVDYVENNKANVDWEWLRRHNRHATKEQTQDYISELTAYFINEREHKFIDYTKAKRVVR